MDTQGISQNNQQKKTVYIYQFMYKLFRFIPFTCYLHTGRTYSISMNYTLQMIENRI